MPIRAFGSPRNDLPALRCPTRACLFQLEYFKPARPPVPLKREHFDELLKTVIELNMCACRICAGAALAPATSEPGLGSRLPHLHRDADTMRDCHRRS